MNPGHIWWNQIGTSLRFVARVTDYLHQERPVILHLPERMPWPEVFREAVEERRAAFCGQRSLLSLAAQPGADPGAQILSELCSDRVRTEYWPCQTVGAYLSGCETLVLNACCIWVTGIRQRQDLIRWMEFVSDYEHHCGGRSARAVFLLEYCGPEPGNTCLDRLRFRVEEHDCRVFCLELAAALGNSLLRTYQAELALAIGGGDPQNCARLLETGESLLRDPVGMGARVLERWDAHQEALITSAVWKAQIVLLFPVLERFRMQFIDGWHDRLLGSLPVQSSNGERVTDPRELELGALYYIVLRQIRDLPMGAEADLRLCRRVRNLLAHNRPASYEDVCRLLQWDRENGADAPLTPGF